MEGSVMDLSEYRLDKAKEDLETAEENLNAGKFRASVNRSYYAVFHALRAVTALDHFDSGKHTMCIFSEALMELVESGKYELVAHSHPDYGPVIPSAEDRLFLKLIGQKTSKIISFITGEIRDYSAERFEDL